MADSQGTRPLFITVEEAAKQIGISRNLAWKMVADHRLPSIKLGTRRLVPAKAPGELMAEAYRDQAETLAGGQSS
jgi:excisionase family DNA binding protein